MKILLLGSGKTATWSVKGLSALTPDIKQIDYFSLSGKKATFEEMGKVVGIALTYVPEWRDALSEYNIVICHTRAESPILNKQDITHIKPGAQLHSFITSTERGN